jgi:hypothetical protein
VPELGTMVLLAIGLVALRMNRLTGGQTAILA